MTLNPLAPLKGLRALDLTDDKGFLCGRMLADLGVDVIKVEPPGGDPSRMIGPFYRDIAEPEKSLYWFAYNANKRGITLKLDREEGKEVFKKLAERTDFVIESFPPGYLAKLGLDYASLTAINPRLILTSISAFGQSGPYADYKAPDLVGMAMSVLMYLCGDPDLPPVRISFPQAYLIAGACKSAFYDKSFKAVLITIGKFYCGSASQRTPHCENISRISSILDMLPEVMKNRMGILNHRGTRRAPAAPPVSPVISHK